MPSGPLTFPFTAVVGMDDAKRALECAFVESHVKTVLLRGGRGTGKSVLARSIAKLAGKTIVNCPLDVTDEQLYGGLDVEKAVSTGKVALEPGLLSRADGNILFIDDANLMDRSVLAGILNAVLSGKVQVERGQISAEYPCRTTLVATMDPEDTDISAHMLDRFDLCAYPSEAEPSERRLILERERMFSEDPDEFLALFEKSESEEQEKIQYAKKVLPLVTVSDELVSVISELCIKVGADGIRGDLAIYNCSRAIAALNGRDEVRRKDVEEAAVLCLPHRRNYDQPPPERPPEQNEPQQEEQEEPPQRDENNDQDQKTQTEKNEEPDEPPEENDSPPENLPEGPGLEEMMFEIGRQFRVIDYLHEDGRLPARTKTRKGLRSMAVSADGTGRYARSRFPSGSTTDIAFDATLRAAAPYQLTREKNGMAISIESNDIREKVRERRSGATLLFLVDASGSLGVRKRMATVKGAILSMLRDSYVKRDRVGLMAFRRDSAEMILPPTKSVEYSYRHLEDLPTGGKTPLGEALVTVNEYMTAYARCHIGERCYIILVTDGRANVPLKEGADANDEVQKLAEDMAIPSVKWIVVDAGAGFPHFDNAQKLAEKLEAKYFRLEDLDADRFAECVKSAIRN